MRIENNAEVEAKPPSVIKSKGAKGKHKMECNYSCILKKPKQVSFSDKQYALCKKHVGPWRSRVLAPVTLVVVKAGPEQ